jgi:hypothetical protein
MGNGDDRLYSLGHRLTSKTHGSVFGHEDVHVVP